ncbi:MAG: hypothetical protein V3T86_03945, partial [Planctomycetota bacterium]
MKLFQILLLNVVTVALALLIYDSMQDDAPAASQVRSSSERSADLPAIDLEPRLRALEAQSLAAPEDLDLGFEERLAALEEALQGADAPEPRSEDGEPIEPRATVKPGQPTEVEINRFRLVRDAVHREDRAKKVQAKVDGALKKLSIPLTERQRKRIHVAFADFQPRVDEIWTEVKTQARATAAAGGQVNRGEIVTSTMVRISTEFAGKLTDVVPNATDAQAVADAL